MLMGTVVGCGSSKDVGTPGSSGEAKEEAGASGEVTSGGDKLVYWSMWESTEPQGQAIEQAVQSYTEETGIEVDLQFKGRTGIREGLQAALDAGTAIDIFDEDIDRVNSTWAQYLLNLEDLAAASDYEATANSGLIGACREAGGGELMTIPYQPNIFAFFYNTEIFAEAGIDAVPTTWNEFLAVSEKIKKAGYTPITSDDAYIISMFGYHMSRLVGEPAVEDIINEGLWDDPAVLATAKAYEELAAKGYFSETIEGNVWPSGQNSELALGTAGMYLNGSWLPNEVRDMADFEWGCFSYPAVDGGVDGVEASNYGAQVLAINKESKNAEAAFALIAHITQGENDANLAELSVGIPADSRNAQWPELLKNVKPIMDSLTVRYPWSAGAEVNVDMTPIIKENFLKLCGGSIGAEEFVNALKAASK